MQCKILNYLKCLLPIFLHIKRLDKTISGYSQVPRSHKVTIIKYNIYYMTKKLK